MPTIKHEGRTYVLKTYRMKCLECNGFCETSRPYPNIAYCPCGTIKLDGGISMGANEYFTSLDRMEDHSIYRTEDKPKLQLPQEIVAQVDRIRRERLKAQMEAYNSKWIQSASD